MYTYIYFDICLCEYIHRYTYLSLYTERQICLHIFAYILVYALTYIHICTYTHTHTHIYIYIYIYYKCI